MADRCKHGVWLGDLCYACERETTTDEVATLKVRLAEKDQYIVEIQREARERLEAVEKECDDLIAGKEYQAMQRTLAEANERCNTYALQVCLCLDTMREAGVHITEKWCWCQPTVIPHGDGITEVDHHRRDAVQESGSHG